jgi:C4-dicarboxylate-specific signal transduction histidine kinase
MKSQNKDHLREMQLAYIGRLMAGLSHEFKNHLAIIREFSGLVADLLDLEEAEDPTNRERYKKIISGIDERVTQAAEMCRFLSRFSHRMDKPLASFSVNDLLQEEMYLLHRFARQKQVELVSSYDDDLPVIFNNPSLLQFAIFCIVWPALELLETNGRILIALRRQAGAVEIVLHLQGAMNNSEGATPWHEMLPEIIPMLGAELSRRSNQEGNSEIVLRVSSIEKPQHNET